MPADDKLVSAAAERTTMDPTIGFILITHQKPHQIMRLVRRLNSTFGKPSIVCHHDFSKCALPLSSFPENVLFVRPHLETGWATFSVVEATVRALRQMYGSPSSPDWVVLLSGADYPIKPSAKVLRDLSAGSYDAHIHFESIRANVVERDWQRIAFNRYCTRNFTYPSLTKRMRRTKRTVCLKHPLLTWPFLPFSKNLRCFAGGQWFATNRRAADYIISFHSSNPGLAAHYSKLKFSEESYFQTILANAEGLRLNNSDWRYTDWSAGGPHPKTLLLEDLPNLLASPAHFARKFDIDLDIRILDEVDSLIG